MLTFYTNPMSRGRIVRWMLEEIGQPYETVILDYATTMKAPEYLKLNPLGKVPTIVHDGQVVTECAAICTYLADAFPAAGLMPKNRGTFYRWMFFGAGPVEAAVTDKALGVTVPDERRRMVGYANFAMMMDVLEQRLSEVPYFCGADFSAADVYVGSQIGFGLRFKTIEPRPVFTAYAERLAARPAYKKANDIDDALMPKNP